VYVDDPDSGLVADGELAVPAGEAAVSCVPIDAALDGLPLAVGGRVERRRATAGGSSIEASGVQPGGRRSYDSRVPSPHRSVDLASTAVLRLSSAGRRWRLAATVVVLALTFGGSVFGDDSWFPVGPFSMYAGRADPDGQVASSRVVGFTAAGEEVRLSGGAVGLRRAEFEGQLPRLAAQPELVELLAQAYSEWHPDAEPLIRVQVVQRRTDLVDGEPTGVTERGLDERAVGGAP
jgi:hypothetical protein